MSQFVLSAASISQLGKLTETVEVVSENGERLGVFSPAPTPEDYARALEACPYTEAELSKMSEEAKTAKGRSLAEIWRSFRERGLLPKD